MAIAQGISKNSKISRGQENPVGKSFNAHNSQAKLKTKLPMYAGFNFLKLNINKEFTGFTSNKSSSPLRTLSDIPSKLSQKKNIQNASIKNNTPINTRVLCKSQPDIEEV